MTISPVRQSDSILSHICAELRAMRAPGEHLAIIGPNRDQLPAGTVGRLLRDDRHFALVDVAGSPHLVRWSSLLRTDAGTTNSKGFAHRGGARPCREGCGRWTVNHDRYCDPCWLAGR